MTRTLNQKELAQDKRHKDRLDAVIKVFDDGGGQMDLKHTLDVLAEVCGTIVGLYPQHARLGVTQRFAMMMGTATQMTDEERTQRHIPIFGGKD